VIRRRLVVIILVVVGVALFGSEFVREVLARLGRMQFRRAVQLVPDTRMRELIITGANLEEIVRAG
jgi:hypothetical protein